MVSLACNAWARFVCNVQRCHEARIVPARQQPFYRIDRVDQSRERLVEFVCGHGGQVARRREARRMKEPVAQVLETKTGLFALGSLVEQPSVAVAQINGPLLDAWFETFT